MCFDHVSERLSIESVRAEFGVRSSDRARLKPHGVADHHIQRYASSSRSLPQNLNLALATMGDLTTGSEGRCLCYATDVALLVVFAL